MSAANHAAPVYRRSDARLAQDKPFDSPDDAFPCAVVVIGDGETRAPTNIARPSQQARIRRLEDAPCCTSDAYIEDCS